MPIDPSIPLRAGQGVTPPVNLLTAGSQALGMANQYQNLLTMKAKAAAGQDFQNSIGPDGTLNGATLNQNLANDPAASRSAVETSQAGQSNIGQALQNAGLTQMQAHQRLTFIGDALGAKVVNNQPVTQKDAQNIIGTLVSAHGMTAKEGAQIIGHLASLPDDQLQSTARNLYALAQHGAQQLAPAVSLVNNGPNNVPFQSNPAAGPVGPMAGATGVPNGLSPTTLATQVPVVGANGAPAVQNLGNVLHAQNVPTQGGPPNIGPLLAQASQMANQGGPGANDAAAQAWLKQQLAAQGRQPQTPAMAPNALAGGVPTGLAPGVAQAATATAQNSAQQGNALTNDMVAIPQQRAALQQVALEINGANPGPLNEQLTRIGGVLTQLGYPSDQATASQLMHKASALNAISSVADGLGVPTDGKMQAVMSATPNATMTPEAAKAATGMLQGLLDYKQAKGTAWQKFEATNGPTSFPQFQQQWNAQVPNASVFQFQHLPEKERIKYMRSLSVPEQKAFAQGMEQAGTLPTGRGS